MSFSIEAIHGREILDSRGNPTLEVEVLLGDAERQALRLDVLRDLLDQVTLAVDAALDGADVVLAPFRSHWLRQRQSQQPGRFVLHLLVENDAVPGRTRRRWSSRR